MTAIVVARFDSVPSARSAAHALLADGFREDAISILYEDPPKASRQHAQSGPDLSTPAARYGAVASAAALATFGAILGALAMLTLEDPGSIALVTGAALGAYLGALAGTVWVLRGVRRVPVLLEDEGEPQVERVVLLAVQIEPGLEYSAVTLLRDAGGQHIQRERGRWRAGRWAEREPARRMSGNGPKPAGAHRTQWQP
ncbi:hypothetical protein [Bordetella genomosp. 1]|uniref:Uncharacterized protein n=1 Tax=Bordetella genomosp. 1 TaxID=1395607 RepID=A0ABX4F2F9_9BORD|nr:hypothetical protein [Bordetella genomosp. 1]MDQ8031648.1 hypothetical protein [Bordetella sp.]OZI65859.1 hypothetical protein CAL27_12725 [Bordetella genomosp. 1]